MCDFDYYFSNIYCGAHDVCLLVLVFIEAHFIVFIVRKTCATLKYLYLYILFSFKLYYMVIYGVPFYATKTELVILLDTFFFS